MAFEILGHFLFMGDRTIMYCHDLHTIRCYLKQEYVQFRAGDLNSFGALYV
jgi:hypothetical protein